MSDKLDLEALKQEFEVGVRSGKTREVRAKLLTIDQSLLPRQEFATFAGFARRAGAPSWALRLLKPVIHPEDSQPQAPATNSEIASYALALSATGALSEAKKLIKQIENVNTHETLQACAYVCIWGWEYSKAVGFLKRYIEIPGLSEFQLTLAQVNLASSQEYIGHGLKASALADQVISVAGKMNWFLLERDSLLLKAQHHIADQEWSLAHGALAQATAISEKAGLDILLVNKWSTILELYESPTRESSIEAVNKLKVKAFAEQRWEIVRDVDFHCAKIFKDKNLLNRLYFGTPFASYRKRLIEDGKSFWSPPTQYLWQPGGAGGDITLNIATGDIKGVGDSIIKNDLCLKLLRILNSDFYRPFKRGSLFAEVYPDKHYDVTNASHTIANVIQRLRKVIDSHDLPLDVHYSNHQYSLRATGPIDFLIPNPMDARGENDTEAARTKAHIAALKNKWPYQTFTSHQAAEVLSLPQPQVRKLILQAVEEKKILALGETKSRLYRFK